MKKPFNGFKKGWSSLFCFDLILLLQICSPWCFDQNNTTKQTDPVILPMRPSRRKYQIVDVWAGNLTLSLGENMPKRDLQHPLCWSCHTNAVISLWKLFIFGWVYCWYYNEFEKQMRTQTTPRDNTFVQKLFLTLSTFAENVNRFNFDF